MLLFNPAAWLSLSCNWAGHCLLTQLRIGQWGGWGASSAGHMCWESSELSPGPCLQLRKGFKEDCALLEDSGEQQAAERGHRLSPEVFFLTTEAVSSVWFFSGFWKHLIYKGRAERLHRGISTVSSIARTWHLSFPPMSSLSFCWSLKLCRITFYFQLFPLFLHTSSTSCPVLILVAFTFCAIFPHSLSLLCLCLIVLIPSL